MKSVYFFALLGFSLSKTCFAADYQEAMKINQFISDVINEDIAPLKTALSSGFDINTRSSRNGWTSLHYAVMRKKFIAINFLIKNGADPEIKDKFGDTAFDIAKKYPDKKIIKVLSEHRNKNNFTDNSTQKYLPDTVKSIAEKSPANINFKSSFLRLSESDFVDLIESSKDQFKEEVLQVKSYLSNSIKNRKNIVTKYLLEQSCEFSISIDFIDEFGYSALDYALLYRNLEAIDLLSKYGASQSRVLQLKGATLIEYVVMNGIL